MMNWYKIMSGVAGSLIFIAVVIVAYKFIIGGYSIEKRNEAKESDAVGYKNTECSSY